MTKQTTSSSGGVGFLGLLTIVFIALKLTGYINWSWLWVLAPIWAPISLATILGVLGGAFVLLARRT
jgi:hypothetical protein